MTEFHDCLILLIGSVTLALLVHQDFRAARLKIGSHIHHASFHRPVNSPSSTAWYLHSGQALLGLPPSPGPHCSSTVHQDLLANSPFSSQGFGNQDKSCLIMSA